MRVTPKRNTFGGWTGCLILVISWFLLLPLWLLLAGEFLVHSDRPGKAGAVVLLSGGGRERMATTADLMADGVSETLLLTNTGAFSADGSREVDYLRTEMVRLGVPSYRIRVADSLVSSTGDEVLAVRAYLEEHQIESIVVVTDPYHTQRTRLLFRNTLDKSGITVRVVPARGHWYKPYSWFLSREGWQVTFQEYLKLTYSAIN